MQLNEIKKYAENNNIPIMQDESLKYLLKFIKDNNIKSILEIGTAIGYSAINMALVDENITVTSIEKDKSRYQLSIEYIKNMNLENRVNVLLADALQINIKDKFDLIFIDAAKSKNIEFFMKFKNNLKDKGIIITDNINFHGLTNNVDNIKNKRLKSLVIKINSYKSFLTNNKEFSTVFINIGDGISISEKNK